MCPDCVAIPRLPSLSGPSSPLQPLGLPRTRETQVGWVGNWRRQKPRWAWPRVRLSCGAGLRCHRRDGASQIRTGAGETLTAEPALPSALCPSQGSVPDRSKARQTRPGWGITFIVLRSQVKPLVPTRREADTLGRVGGAPTEGELLYSTPGGRRGLGTWPCPARPPRAGHKAPRGFWPHREDEETGGAGPGP